MARKVKLDSFVSVLTRRTPAAIPAGGVLWVIGRMLVMGLVLFIPGVALSGGSGLNIAVIVNPNSAQSMALGNYYCELRHVPPQNVIRLQNWTGGNLSWTRAQFQTALLDPLLAGLSTRGLDHQIDYVLLSMDIPYAVTEAGSVNSTTSVLFYGFKPDIASEPLGVGCSLPPFSSNSYAFSESVFRDSPPDTAPANAFLTMMLTATNLEMAKLTVNQGVASDGSFPQTPIILATTSDASRSVRSALFDDAIADCRIQGNALVIRTNQDSPYGLTGLSGYETGLGSFDILPNTFLPGAMADNLTSFSGVILVPNYQTTLLSFLAAGATASYGTIVEPCNLIEKFPSPLTYFYQARGFSIAESYYQSLENPFEGLIVGDPLAAPFASKGVGSWSAGLAPGAILHGVTNLAAQFLASDASRPLQQVDLFLDGVFLQTLTNVVPVVNNLLWVACNGTTANYTVPAEATLESVTRGLSDAINASSNMTQVAATVLGDRIELSSLDLTKDGSDVLVTAGQDAGLGGSRTTFVKASRYDFLDKNQTAIGRFVVSNVFLVSGDALQLDVIKTNGERISLSVTNLGNDPSPLPMVSSLADLVNTNAALQKLDGVNAYLYPSNTVSVSCALFLQARASVPAASQIQATLTLFSTNNASPALTTQLNWNAAEVQPRNHLYLTSGVTNLSVAFSLDTASLSDGYHELTAVAYEGSHVRAQTSTTQSVVVSNTPLAASLTVMGGVANSAINNTLQFSVSANSSAVASIELLSTGGTIGIITNQGSGTFAISGSYLGEGLHPFYAIITSTSGAQYRTETKWIRLVAQQPSFALTIGQTPTQLFWTAVPGRSYDILSTDSLTNSFQIRASVVPTNEVGQWLEGEPSQVARFYRVRSSP